MTERQSEGPSFSVEMGSDNIPRLRLTLGAKEFPLPVSVEQCAQLGQALLAASSLGQVANATAAPGAPIVNALHPAKKWRTGRMPNNGRPVLFLTTAAGAELGFVLTPEAAKACAEALYKLGPLPDTITF
jgi:hypothetical protein